GMILSRFSADRGANSLMSCAVIVVIGLVLSRFADGIRDPVTVVENFWTSAVAAGGVWASAAGTTMPTMAPAPSACITASDSFFLFAFNMQPPMESLDNYNSLGRYPQIRTAMATGTARSYGLFRCTRNTEDRFFCREIDRSLFWKRLDITTMMKRAATKCCACYTGSCKTVANLPTK